MPVDMKDLSARITAAKNAVLFLAFIPGTPSITEFAAAAPKANKNLFVRGCVLPPDAAGNFYYDMKIIFSTQAGAQVLVSVIQGNKSSPRNIHRTFAPALDHWSWRWSVRNVTIRPLTSTPKSTVPTSG